MSLLQMVCARCNKAEGLYEDVEVTGHTWRAIDVTWNEEHGKPEITGDTPERLDVQFEDDFPLGSYGCSECGYRGKLNVQRKAIRCEHCKGGGCHRCSYEGLIDPAEPRIAPGQLAMEEAA